MDSKLFIEFALSHLPIMGRYALEVQSRIASQPEKDYGNIFAAALTDADLSVQNYFEVVLLSEFPDLRFFGEEEENSLNAKYFTKNGRYEITLDPINGTRFYMDQLNVFDCILTLTEDDQLRAAVSYFPGLGQAYYAIKGEGAFIVPIIEGQLDIKDAVRVVLSAESKPVAIFDADGDLLHRLKGVVPVWDFLKEYETKKNGMTLGSVLMGDLAGWVRTTSPLIDAGAISFIAEEAGAIVTGFSGDPIVRYPVDNDRDGGAQIVAVTKELHEALLKRLQ